MDVTPEAARGTAWAQNNLGNLYLSGNGVEEDDDTAISWFRKAADQGDPGGELSLGQAYELGLGSLPQDRAQAGALYRQSGERGRRQGWEMLQRLCNKHNGALPGDCAQIPPGTKTAPDWGGHIPAGSVIKLIGAMVVLGFSVWRLVKLARSARKPVTPPVNQAPIAAPEAQVPRTLAGKLWRATRVSVLAGGACFLVLTGGPRNQTGHFDPGKWQHRLVPSLELGLACFVLLSILAIVVPLLPAKPLWTERGDKPPPSNSGSG